jgi:hypothetical protein
LSLLGTLAGLGGIRRFIRLRSSNIGVGHGIFFRTSTRKYFPGRLVTYAINQPLQVGQLQTFQDVSQIL